MPPETDFGCLRHRSKKCGPDVRGSNTVNMYATVVMPGKTISFDFDIGSEYKLDSTQSYLVDVVARDFVLVDAPKSVTDAPTIFRNLYLSHYETYNYTKLEPIRSNTITIK